MLAFTKMLIEANGLDSNHFLNWTFCPGMLFNSPDKWWGDRGRRDFPHEGLDFCLYSDFSGRLLRMDERTRIPVLADGVIRAIFTDYLGQALVVDHDPSPSAKDRYLSIYAHTQPCANLRPGDIVRKGEIVATIADTSRSKAKILPHLHLTIGRPNSGLVYEPFVWNMMRDPRLVTLLNPINIVDWPYQVLDARDQFCLDL